MSLFEPSSICTNQVELCLLVYFDQNDQSGFDLFHGLYSHRLLPGDVSKDPDVPPLLQLFEEDRLESEEGRLCGQSDPYDLQIPS